MLPKMPIQWITTQCFFRLFEIEVGKTLNQEMAHWQKGAQLCQTFKCLATLRCCTTFTFLRDIFLKNSKFLDSSTFYCMLILYKNILYSNCQKYEGHYKVEELYQESKKERNEKREQYNVLR